MLDTWSNLAQRSRLRPVGACPLMGLSLGVSRRTGFWSRCGVGLGRLSSVLTMLGRSHSPWISRPVCEAAA